VILHKIKEGEKMEKDEKKNMIPSYNSLIVIGSFMSTVIVICYGKKRKNRK